MEHFKSKLQKAEVSFFLEDEEVSFSIWHNLPQSQGMNIEAAVQNWLVRTKQYTAKSLCRYINSKNTGYTVWEQSPVKAS